MNRFRFVVWLVMGFVLLAVAALAADAFAEAVGPVTDGVHVKPDPGIPPNFPASPTAVTFYLPWKGGQTWNTTNGHCNDGHSCDSANQYALDFTPGATGDVVAVADGTVCYVQESIPDSATFSGPHAGNVVIIAHEGNCVQRQNGTYSFYAHLKYNSVPVSSGQTISRGTVIGRYGDSGYAFGAHLHFSINSQYWTYSQYGYATGSGITKFATFADQDVQRTGGVPKKGQSYRSDNYQGFQCTDVLPVGEGSSRKQLFVDAYNRMGGRDRLGCTRGGAYWWHDPTDVRKAVRQDFTSPGGDNQVMITHDEAHDSPSGSIPAYVTWGSIYTRYMELGGINAGNMGIPTSDEFVNAAGDPQSNFASGYITWDGNSYEFYNWPSYVDGQWRVKYFNGKNHDFNRLPTWMMNLNTTGIDLSWGTGSPGNDKWGVWKDTFSMVAAKQTVFNAGRYRFHVQADDGAKLWVDSTLLIDEWHASSGNNYYAEIDLSQAVHLLVFAYYEEAGGALVKLDWAKINPPAAPTINPISNADGDGNYTVSWSTVSGATNYRLQEQFNGGSFGDAYAGSNTSIARTDRPVGQWCYRAHAWNSAGSSNWSGTVCTTVAPAAKPDLLPFAPSGYQYPVVPSSVTGTVVAGPLTAGEATYFDWHFKNAGTASAPSGFYVELWVDDTRHVRYQWGAVGVGAVEGFDDWMEYVNTPGTHTVRLIIDPDNIVAESNENNNSWERQFTWDPPPDPAALVFLNPTGAGSVGGLAFTASDILRYEQAANRWTMVYDGSARGTPKKLSAFSLLNDGKLLLVFAANQPIPGLGTATPYDVVLFTPNTPHVYPLGPGAYSWFFQGKPLGLSTSGEKIDAIDWVGAWLSFSTSGAAKLPLANGSTLKAADEDVFVYELNNSRWRDALLLDGSLIPGLGGEDVVGLWDDPSSNDLYVTISGSFNLGGLAGNGKSIVRLTANGGSYTPSLVPWLSAGASFPSSLGELDLGP